MGLNLSPILRNSARVDCNFWYGKRVLITGHTGFKGSWLSLWLASMGAHLTGYAQAPETRPNLFELLKLQHDYERSIFADVRDLKKLQAALKSAQPEIVIHMAAQPLVRRSYEDPVETYSTNVMGTVNLLESIRTLSSVRAVLIVTTDKCYDNQEWIWGYRETEPLGGRDPYSSSKACAELVAAAYRNIFLDASDAKHQIAVATARAGNVIGGGDWSADRLIPDALRASDSRKILLVRYPEATRPWQHVLEPIAGYLTLAQNLYQVGSKFSGAWNFGPDSNDVQTVAQVIDALNTHLEIPISWQVDTASQPHEAYSLRLDCSKASQYLDWHPRWNLDTALGLIARWHECWRYGEQMRQVCLNQIQYYASNIHPKASS